MSMINSTMKKIVPEYGYIKKGHAPGERRAAEGEQNPWE